MSGISNLLLVAVGLGFVIFVHELGHFAVAKWAGVLVERFSIGFGPILWRFRGQETEYALSAIPFGGYVKMLGENPEEATRDPRAYSQQSVPKRMAIISAGVIMNIIFGFLFFLLVFNLGVPYMPAVVGAIEPGGPAWQAGVSRGDQIVEINGDHVTEFETFQQGVWLSRPDRELDLLIERAGKRLHVRMIPQVNEMMPHIGVLQPLDLVLDDTMPVVPGSAAASAEGAPFEKRDRIRGVDGQEIDSYPAFADFLARHASETIRVRVERAAPKGQTGATAEVVVPPNYMRDLGLRLQMGKIIALQDRSPAQTGGLEVGDVIKSINQKPFDPLRLPDLIAQLAETDVEIEVIRQSPTEQTLRRVVHPEDRRSWTTPPYRQGNPLTIPALGVAYQLVPAITEEPAADSPAARAGLHKDDRITGAVVLVSADSADGKTGTIDFPIDDKHPNLPALFWSLQYHPNAELKLTVKRGDETRTSELFSPQIDPAWPAPVRGINLTPLSVRMPPQGFTRSIALGYETTWSTIAKIYLTLRRLVTHSIPLTNLSGPIGIGVAAYHQAATSVTVLIKFLGILSINLAIVNFLPIPVLDGGHMVFLAWEWIRGKPVSERVQVAANYCGLIVILTLALLVTGHDILQLVRWRGGF